MQEYVPQPGFLALLMTGDGYCIGAKHGIGMYGKWVWGLKDHIDMGFMNLFNPKYLFNDYENKGTSEPIESDTLFENELAKERKAKVDIMEPAEGAAILSSGSEDEDFLMKWAVL